MITYKEFHKNNKNPDEVINEVLFPSSTVSQAMNAVMRFTAIRQSLNKPNIDQTKILSDMITLCFSLIVLEIAQTTQNASLAASSRRFVI
jgi:hypothetical protein